MGKTVQPVRPREAFEIRENIQKPFVLHDQLAFVLVKKTLTQQGRGGGIASLFGRQSSLGTEIAKPLSANFNSPEMAGRISVTL
jgi:hypothetical protein